MGSENKAQNPPSRRYDVVVAGARCAGAATAMLLARRGLRVLVVDRERYGADTLSTHALMRGGVLQLHRWGVLDEVKAAGTPTVRSTAFHYGDEILEIPIKPKDGIDGLYAPRRRVIDRLLVDAVRSAGGEVVYETRLVDLARSDNRVRGARLRSANGEEFNVGAEIVIGADGVHSTVAGLVGAQPYKTGRHATGVVFSYWADTNITGYHWCYRPGLSVGVIPTNDGLACVFVSVAQSRFHDAVGADIAEGYQRLLKKCNPRLGDTIERATQAEKYRGFGGQVGFFRQSYGPGWALVGDAGYFKDPLTAHGMTDALIDAELLAHAVARGSESALADYQRARDERAMSLFEVTDAIASFDWDLASVAQLHRSLSDEMKKETAAVMNWNPDGPQDVR
ncbi:MAG TPA: NAD(P)/FAD-dependent oxidoreductase [Terriglobia bacterium]|nr:NAD(P)/FAD-dependent oxidoreductase [Terriglobia bacterium]